MPHPLNRRTVVWLAAVVFVCLAFVLLAVTAGSADAAGRSQRSAGVTGHPPSEATLTCIRQWETGGGVYGRANYADPGSNWNATARTYDGFATAYQMDDDFARAHSAPIPDEHWAMWGDSRADPPWTWHPMIQDETARNGFRARGIAPWPPGERHRCNTL